MKSEKAVSLDLVPVEIWKCLGEEGLKWLTELFNIILRIVRMPNEWRISIVILLYENKGDIQDYNNYQGIKLLNHTMKLWERIIKGRLKKVISISEN